MSQLQSAVDLQGTFSTQSGVHAPSTQAQKPPSIAIMGGAVAAAHVPVFDWNEHAALLLQPVFTAAFFGSARRSAHPPATQRHVPGLGALSSHATLGFAVAFGRQAVGMHGSSKAQSMSATQAFGAALWDAADALDGEGSATTTGDEDRLHATPKSESSNTRTPQS